MSLKGNALQVSTEGRSGSSQAACRVSPMVGWQDFLEPRVRRGDLQSPYGRSNGLSAPHLYSLDMPAARAFHLPTEFEETAVLPVAQDAETIDNRQRLSRHVAHGIEIEIDIVGVTDGMNHGVGSGQDLSEMLFVIRRSTSRSWFRKNRAGELAVRVISLFDRTQRRIMGATSGSSVSTGDILLD